MSTPKGGVIIYKNSDGELGCLFETVGHPEVPDDNGTLVHAMDFKDLPFGAEEIVALTTLVPCDARNDLWRALQHLVLAAYRAGAGEAI